MDKNDPIHSRELSAYYEIISQLLKCYPEPWTAKELNLKEENTRLSEGYAVAYAKKLAKKNWVQASPQRGYKAITMTGELAGEINDIYHSVSK